MKIYVKIFKATFRNAPPPNYICTEYRTSNKCKSFIILEYETSKSIVKHKIKETIRKSPFFLLDIRPKRMFNEISQDIGLICPEFNSIRTQIIRCQNKQLPTDITSFEEIPEESEYYKTENAKLITQYNEDIFADESKFNNIIVISPINFHCDFEKGISNAANNLNYYNNIEYITNNALIECYKNKEEKLICIGCDDDDILLINCKLRRSQSSLHTARRCIPNVPTYISNDHEHQNGTINSSLVGVIIGDWKFYNHQGLCFNSKRSIRVGLMDITCGLMISQDRNLIRLFVTCIVLTDWTNMAFNIFIFFGRGPKRQFFSRDISNFEAF
ncbi:hypothetical protein H8356DRAFT_1421696 [Neocallimastix lanati (nom. inval.)]|nr:hypothetical protein H8356DRAFT_1421696 [Neocallimastix sp. JGI-2020a]